MVDIRLINILPQPTVQGTSQPQVTQGGGSQGAVSVNLPPGTVLSGFIVNRDSSGNPVLRTDKGDVTFSSNFFLKIGSEVTIRIENNASGSLARILSVNGQSPEVAQTVSAFDQVPDVLLSQNLTAGKPTVAPQIAVPVAPQGPAQPALTVTGTLVTPQPNATLPAGTQITLKVTTLDAAPVAQPAQAAAEPQQAAPSALSLYSAYTRAAPTTPATGTPTPSLVIANPGITGEPAAPSTVATPAQTMVTTPQATPTQSNVVVANETPQAPVPSPASVVPGQTITASVTGREPSGEVIVQTPAGAVRLQAGTVLPSASKVTFEVVSLSTPAEQAGKATAQPAPLTQLARQWTSLQQITTLLAARPMTADAPSFALGNMPWLSGTNPGAALPISAQNMPVGLVLFVSALRGGDFGNWLGSDNIKWLREAGHDSLIRKAEGEFLSMGRQFTEAQPGHWQPLFFPVAVHGEVQQARLFVKRDRKQGKNQQGGKESEDTRFVVEVDLSQLGEMQMDGFVRKQEKEVHFDLVIRSLMALPADIQQDILRIYNDTGQMTGFKGSLVFQNVREFPLHPMEEIVAQGIKNVVA